ncbi:hypothetical protein FB451DRAFT_1408459 [Mycena latifolia]|nr:hypothetical protein FB451DRAFT_1408459 [Mycena latifolia]
MAGAGGEELFPTLAFTHYPSHTATPNQRKTLAAFSLYSSSSLPPFALIMQIWHPYANGRTSRGSLYVHRGYQSDEDVRHFDDIEEDICSVTESIQNCYDFQSASVVGIHAHYHDDELVTVSTEAEMPISAPLSLEDNAMPPEGRGNVYVMPETVTVNKSPQAPVEHIVRTTVPFVYFPAPPPEIDFAEQVISSVNNFIRQKNRRWILGNILGGAPPPFMTVRPAPPPLKDAKEVATIRSARLETGILIHEMYSTPWKPLREGSTSDRPSRTAPSRHPVPLRRPHLTQSRSAPRSPIPIVHKLASRHSPPPRVGP